MDVSRTMEMAALGRPFGLGMLYNCCRDELIPSLTLWDQSDLEKGTVECQKRHTEAEIVASESMADKSQVLKVDASLKASFLGGLVKVDGSAKYLNDRRTSKSQARVTLSYQTTTRFHQLSMSHLGRGNAKHPYVFDEGKATHVVTGILYGAQAFFVFDREVSDAEDRQDVEGFLKVMINKIPTLSIEGEGDLHMEDGEREKVNKFSCKFHGDFFLEKPPVSYQDAIEIYRGLPGLLGPNGENAVPVTVWLLPLSSLDSSAVRMVRQVSINLVQESQRILEDLDELDTRCGDAMKMSTAQNFPQIGKKLKDFRDYCDEFKLVFRRTLAEKLPRIRGGLEGEAELTEVMRRRHLSPFNGKYLEEWMGCKEKEICFVKSFTTLMKNAAVVRFENSLPETILSAEHAVAFVFTSLGDPEPYLAALSDYLKGTATEGGEVGAGDIEEQQWFHSDNISDKMRTQVKLFGDFAEANDDNRGIKFLTVALSDKKHKGSSIYLYNNGFLTSKNFELPSRPEAVAVSDADTDSVTLRVERPRFGLENITSYSVEYCAGGRGGWERKMMPKSEEVTVTGLTPNVEYRFRCRAVTSVGVGPAGELGRPVKTRPCGPPGNPQVESNSSEITVIWEKPARLGKEVQVWNYVVEFAKTSDCDGGARWERVEARAEKAVISGLDPETEYAVRIRCNCGADGESKNSATVSHSTTRQDFPSVRAYLRHISKKLPSGVPSVYKLPLKEEDLDIEGCRKFRLGKDSLRPNRTVMLVGATGSGKSTLIDGMINYIVGVHWEDDFRFKLVREDPSRSQAESQTAEVTVYKINHHEGFRVRHSLTIIDTPGFGDTRGISRDKEIMEQIRRLFTSPDGVREVDMVCFTAQASLARLTHTQRYVFDSVLSIFGKDLEENIRLLVTFADGRQPPVLEAIKASGVPCPKDDLGLPVNFVFNNSALFADNRGGAGGERGEDSQEEDDDNFDKMFWKMGTKNMDKFFVALSQMTTKSLQMTKEVLQECKQLEVAVEGLQPQVKVGLAKLQEIKSAQEKILEQESVLSANENFEIEVDVLKPVMETLTKPGEFITNCQACSVTCHYPCAISKNSEKSRCSAMDLTGNCNVCPGRCHWSVHFNQTYRWNYVQVKEKKAIKELKDKYEQASKQKLTIQELVQRQEEEIFAIQDMVVSLIDRSAACLARLQEIALRPNPLTVPGYIDMLIEGEKAEAREGYLARVASLEAMKDRARIISKVTRREDLTKSREEQQRDTQQRKEKRGFFTGMLNFFRP